jgi:hypothetical protein
MTRNFELEPFWNDENFAVQRGVIGGSTTLSGADLGRGIIYHPVDAHLTYRLPGDIETVISSPVGNLACLYNPGTDAEIINRSVSPTNVFWVTLKYPEQLVHELPEDYIGRATSILLQGDWSDNFKASVQMDLEAIHRLVPTGFASEPSSDDILLASMAKEDLELKLSWFSSWLRYQEPLLNLGDQPGEHANFTQHVTPLINFGFRRFTGPTTAASPPGKITVTVTTKDQAGQEVGGCIVWANYRGYQNNTANALAFSNPSSPTTDDLTVAIYNMWAEKGGRQGPVVPIRIAGGASPTAQSVGLLAP